MRKTLVAIVVIAAGIFVAAAQAHRAHSSTTAIQLSGNLRTQSSKSVSPSPVESAGPKSFEGTWQGVWHGYGVVHATEKGLPSSLSLTLSVKAAANGKLSGITSTSGFQHSTTQEQNPRLSLGAPPPPIPPPPPPLPTPPPSGKMLNPRIEGHALAFEVKTPDGKVADFRLSLQAPDAGTLNVTLPTHSRVYPELQMKRTQ